MEVNRIDKGRRQKIKTKLNLAGHLMRMDGVRGEWEPGKEKKVADENL